jgi:hypothetical protein
MFKRSASRHTVPLSSKYELSYDALGKLTCSICRSMPVVHLGRFRFLDFQAHTCPFYSSIFL